MNNVAADKKTLTQFLVTYGQKGDIDYRVGFNMIRNKVDAVTPANSLTEKGTELWAWARKDKFGGYLRSETLDNGKANSATEKRLVVSLDYHATKAVVVSLVSDSTSDVAGVAGDKKSKTGLFTQFKF